MVTDKNQRLSLKRFMLVFPGVCDYETKVGMEADILDAWYCAEELLMLFIN
jgi:hypothetical protein